MTGRHLVINGVESCCQSATAPRHIFSAMTGQVSCGEQGAFRPDNPARGSSSFEFDTKTLCSCVSTAEKTARTIILKALGYTEEQTETVLSD
jgi:hypothetical protein